jgi:hypothetical protein
MVQRGEREARQAKKEMVEANLPGHLDCQEIHQPRPAIPRPDPGRQYRPDEGGGQIRIPPRLQVRVGPPAFIWRYDPEAAFEPP